MSRRSVVMIIMMVRFVCTRRFDDIPSVRCFDNYIDFGCHDFMLFGMTSLDPEIIDRQFSQFFTESVKIQTSID